MITINGHEINITRFPDGTSQVWQMEFFDTLIGPYNIEWKFLHEGELFHLTQLIDLIYQSEKFNSNIIINLNMPFLPYGRQDKEINNGNTFALNSFCLILGSMGIDNITTLDAHSNLSDNLLGIKSIYPKEYIDNTLDIIKPDAVVFPDKGASKRYTTELHLMTGDKVRDQSTGWITDYSVDGDVKGKRLLIIDDICDGGMTFILLSKSLLEKGAKEVHLYTTHGIFSKGIDPLHKAGIKKIFTYEGQIKRMKDKNHSITKWENIK